MRSLSLSSVLGNPAPIDCGDVTTESCGYSEPDGPSYCVDGHFCRRYRNECKYYDENGDLKYCVKDTDEKCTKDESDKCKPKRTATPRATPTATPTMTSTATPKITPTISPTPTATPNFCGGTCGSNSNCQDGLFCYQGLCRNPSCSSEADCGCPSATSTPPPVLGVTAPPVLPETGGGLLEALGLIGIGLLGVYVYKRANI